MAIAFVCSCGKALKAREAFAGRKVKCPQCNTIVRIPSLDGVPGDGEPVPATHSLSQATILPAARRAAGTSPAHEIGSSDVLPTITPRAKATPPPMPTPAKSKPALPSPHGPMHAWVDTSLMQQTTPWLSGDEERFQRGIKAPREGLTTVEITAALVVLVAVGLGVMGWFLLFNK